MENPIPDRNPLSCMKPNSGQPLPDQGFQGHLQDGWPSRTNAFHSTAIRRLSLGAALLGCALSCVQETSAQGAGTLVSGTVSNFSVTGSVGTFGGTFSTAGPSTGFIDSSWAVGSGSGTAAGLSLAPEVDIVGFSLVLPSAVTGIGSGSGSFTMNFTTSVTFMDFATLNSIPFPSTSWTVTGLGSISDGQTFNPGSYTFNFTTTTGSSPENGIGSVAAFFLPIPELPPSGALLGTSSLLLMADALRRRRSKTRLKQVTSLPSGTDSVV